MVVNEVLAGWTVIVAVSVFVMSTLVLTFREFCLVRRSFKLITLIIYRITSAVELYVVTEVAGFACCAGLFEVTADISTRFGRVRYIKVRVALEVHKIRTVGSMS